MKKKWKVTCVASDPSAEIKYKMFCTKVGAELFMWIRKNFMFWIMKEIEGFLIMENR